MKRLLYLSAIALLLLTGCKTKEVIRYVPVEVPVITERIDSVTVNRTDSIFIRERNDTVFYERFKTIYKDKVKIERDTVTNIIEVPVEIEVEKIVEKRVYGFIWYAGLAAIAFVIYKLYIWVRKRFKLFS